MGFPVWMCVLCLQASLLSHALDSSGGAGGVRGQTADHPNHKHQKDLSSNGQLVFHRNRRQLERRGPTHLSHPNMPGAVTVRGFPQAISQADRSRRHLVQVANKKKSKRKSRIGSFSLLSNNKSNPLQVIRARRQVKPEAPKRGKSSGRSGAYSVLGDPETNGQNNGPERSA
ncbi:uncharacterized protein si:dkey-12l12.1 isoform X1 [Synchiropus splendidus]|uniref:uncharacterized protein si:dkey-12l12.1 isoform X1 n=1 Tax=Synchiropus splendidus TaxID=270530 RepID=UPI00237DBD22|nr:uncharacterized protein si:dkey-12l12.1 isoform X1 [Synchiropus splendidus]